MLHINFFEGQYVETVDGNVGYIDHICTCKICKERGFYKPCVIFSNGETKHITVYEYENGMNGYKQIGNVKIENQQISS